MALAPNPPPPPELRNEDMSELYTFHRKEGFYPLELADDDDACRNAECNPGTIRVMDIHGRVVWPVGEPQPDDNDPPW